VTGGAAAVSPPNRRGVAALPGSSGVKTVFEIEPTEQVKYFKSGNTILQMTFYSVSFEKGVPLMRSKLALSAVVVAALFGATSIASAQTQPAPGASSSGNVGPGATSDSKMKSGTTTTTTGAGTSGAKGNMGGDSSSSGNVGPGTTNNQGKPGDMKK
jgi:hypothetical protein